jgi:hypothetical protein
VPAARQSNPQCSRDRLRSQLGTGPQDRARLRDHWTRAKGAVRESGEGKSSLLGGSQMNTIRNLCPLYVLESVFKLRDKPCFTSLESIAPVTRQRKLPLGHGRASYTVRRSTATALLDSYTDCALSFEVKLVSAGGSHSHRRIRMSIQLTRGYETIVPEPK